ncbi:hypothetical protein UJ101_01151 [Flavobacteriaceae bacterium UJ101]|nr:hypothetical protein UJ101_01151 [Flavobacteriaceae bacterium UJ101]
MKRKLFLILLLFQIIPSHAQKSYKIVTIAFYNVENLFDTIPSVGIIDGTKHYLEKDYHISVPQNSIKALTTEKNTKPLTYKNLEGRKVRQNLILTEEYTPEGKNNWDYKKYHKKLDHISKVIHEIGIKKVKEPPVIVGLAELENEHVLQDLINHPTLKPFSYEMVHFNSFDARGIDVGFIYQKNKFVLEKAHPYPVIIYNDKKHRVYTRDIVKVSGYLDGEKMHFIVNHWPSKRGGERASEYKRIQAAKTCLSIIQDIQKKEPHAKIIVMGDFNDSPLHKSIQTLKTVGKKDLLTPQSLYNPMEIISQKGRGTAAYQDGWETLDQFMITPSLLNDHYRSYTLYQTHIFKPPYLIQQSGQYKGYPFRTYTFGKYLGGYSDHFPIYLYLIKEYK